MRFVSCGLFALLTLFSRPAAAQCGWQPGEGVAGVKGTVERLFPWDPDGPEGPEEELLVVAGRFTAAGTVDTANIAVWRPSDRSWFALGDGLGDAGITAVLCVASTPDGRLFAGGQFTRADGAPADYVAMWDGTQWSPVGEGLNSYVLALAVTPTGLLVAGGSFQVEADGESTAIAAWDGSHWSAVDGGWMSDGNFSGVSDVAILPDGRIAAVGGYYDENQEIGAKIAIWDGSRWNPTGYAGANPFMITVSPSGDLAVGTTAGPGSQVKIRNSQGTWTEIPVPYEFGRAFAVRYLSDGSLIGCFAPSSGHYPYHIVMRWDGSTWNPLGPVRRRAYVYAITEMSDGRLVVGGDENLLEEWSTDRWTSLGNGFSDSVYAAIPRPGGGAYVGGKFRWAHGHNASGVAEWDTEQWRSLGDALNPGGWVFGLVVDSDASVVATGPFLNEHHNTPESIGWWNGTVWSKAPIPHPSTSAEKLFKHPDGAVGVIAGHVWKVRDGIWSHESVGISSHARAATIWNGEVIMCGGFKYIGDVLVNRIARQSGGSWIPLGSGVDLPIYAVLAHSGGDLFVAGDFTMAGEIETKRIARWNGAEWSALGIGIDEYVVRALAELPNGDIIAAGEFTTAGGITANNIARWDGSQWHPLGGGTNGVVRALAVLEDGSLAVGGDFTHVDGKPSAYFARYLFPGSPPAITSQPVDSFACMNAPATFVATAAGDATYQWQIADPLAPEGWSDLADGELEINGATVGFVEGADTGSLTFAPIAATFHTEVRCVVSSQCAEATSDTASLSVCRVDTDCDGLLSDSDFFTFFDAFLACDGSPPGCVSGTTDPDFDRDEVVDIMDFLEYLDSYGTGCL